MAKGKKLSELTVNELYEAKKKHKGIVSILGIAMIIFCGILVSFAVKNENYALLAVASGCFVTLFPSLAYLGQIEKEIKTREQK